jgi:hypothetical protein
VIRNHQQIRRERDLLLVEQHQLFAVAPEAYAYAALDARKIERVHRLAELEHHVVRDVHDRADAAQAAAGEALGHPARCRGTRVDIADDASAIARARCGSFERDVDTIGDGGFYRIRSDRRQHFAGDRRDFARDAENA